MSVNGVTGSNTDVYGTYAAAQKTDTKADQTKTGGTKADAKEPVKTDDKSNGVVYEPSASSAKKTYKPDSKIIAKLKADADARTAQMQSLVEKMISKQGSTLGQADSIWKFLAGGNYEVDPAVKAQAQADIGEDGYWGVKQTSDRIIDFATALTGGNPDKIEEMRAAFEKGFKKATKTWGKSLPDISQRTYSAVMEKFDKLAEDAKTKSEKITDEQ